MYQLEREFKIIGISWKCYAGSILFTLLISFLMASTQFGMNPVSPEKETKTEPIYYLPPPPPEEYTQVRSVGAKDRATLDIGFPDEKDVLEEEPIEHLPLDYLDVSFSLGVQPEINIDFDLRRKLRAVRPGVMDRMIVYEQDKIDENPVRLFVPKLDFFPELRKEGAELLVLYRVTKQGRTENILVLDSTNEEANKLAVRIISGTRFRPARKDGNPVNIWVQQEMIFKKKETGHFEI